MMSIFDRKVREFVLAVEKGMNINNVSHTIGCTYTHALNIKRALEGHGFINSEKKGRSFDLVLTKKGKTLKRYLNKINELRDL